MALEQDILKVLNDVSDVEKKPKELRKEFAKGLSDSIKKNLKLWITKAVPTPQDGGAGLKTTLTQAIDFL